MSSQCLMGSTVWGCRASISFCMLYFPALWTHGDQDRSLWNARRDVVWLERPPHEEGVCLRPGNVCEGLQWGAYVSVLAFFFFSLSEESLAWEFPTHLIFFSNSFGAGVDKREKEVRSCPSASPGASAWAQPPASRCSHCFPNQEHCPFGQGLEVLLEIPFFHNLSDSSVFRQMGPAFPGCAHCQPQHMGPWAAVFSSGVATSRCFDSCSLPSLNSRAACVS